MIQNEEKQMSTTFDQLTPYLDKNMAFQTALTLLDWDTETLAPPAAMDYTSKVVGLLSVEAYHSFINDEVKELLQKLSTEEEQAQLTEAQKAIVRNLKKDFEEMECIPPEEYKLFQELLATSSSIGFQAKRENRFEDFAPILEQIVMYTKKFAGYRCKNGENPYDLLLNDHEEGFSTKELDAFFAKLRETIVPLLKKVIVKNSSIDKSYNFLQYDVEKQKMFCQFLAEYIGFDFERGVIEDSEHPFTTNLHNHDVRITNHIYEDNLESAIFSIIHEVGHGLYEMGVDDALTQTPIGGGVSMGMHESQSRFYENIIGRSKEFWEPIYEQLQEFYPEQLQNISLEHFIKGINKAEPSFIRTEADELTYCLHIMVRYEIEKMLFADEITVAELPRVWNEKYEEYLGITPPTDTLGVLQDMHWSGGSFGYFPSYALGNAIAAQLYYYMLDVMPFYDYLRKGNLSPIREFFREHIHKYGGMRPTNHLLKDLTGEQFNPDYYVRYLTEKYTALYEL